MHAHVVRMHAADNGNTKRAEVQRGCILGGILRELGVPLMLFGYMLSDCSPSMLQNQLSVAMQLRCKAQLSACEQCVHVHDGGVEQKEPCLVRKVQLMHACHACSRGQH